MKIYVRLERELRHEWCWWWTLCNKFSTPFTIFSSFVHFCTHRTHAQRSSVTSCPLACSRSVEMIHVELNLIRVSTHFFRTWTHYDESWRMREEKNRIEWQRLRLGQKLKFMGTLGNFVKFWVALSLVHSSSRWGEQKTVTRAWKHQQQQLGDEDVTKNCIVFDVKLLLHSRGAAWGALDDAQCTLWKKVLSSES